MEDLAKATEASIAKTSSQLPAYQKALNQVIQVRGQIGATKQQALNFVDAQAEIKALEDEIQLLDKQGAIAQQRNDFEAERQANLAKIRKQQELDTKNTQGRFADDPQNLKRQLEAINQKAELDAQAVNDTYRDRLLQIRQELVGKIGEINDLTGNLEDKLQSDIEKINAEEQSAINEAETKYRNDPAQQKELVDLAKQRAEWSRKMVENAYQEQVLSREIETIQRRMAVAQQQNNYQEIERLKLLEAQAQYQQELLNLSKKFATEPEKALEQQNLLQEKLLETNRLIRLDTEAALLGRQKNLADLQSQLAQAQIEAMQRRGLDIESRPLAVSDQKRQERLRYQQQVIDIKRNPNPYEVEEQLAIAAQINQLNIERIDSQFKGLGETITDLGRNGLADFFTNTISGTKNLSDAFGEMAQSILKSLANMMAQLATVELFKLLGLSTAGLSGSQIPGFGTLFGGGEAAPVSGNFSTERLSPFSGGNILDLAGGFTGILNTVLGFAEGGYTGDGGKYEPKGIVHGGEFVMTQWATKQVGIDLLAAINKTGRVPVMAVPPSSGPSMAPPPAPSKTVIINQNFTDQRDRYLTQNRTLLQDAVSRAMK
jgi:regulator of sigma D